MKVAEEVKNSLNVLLKKGDLLDAIAEKEGLRPKKHAFLKTNIFLFSRVLYLGVLAWEKVSRHFIKVDEVKEAQDSIREALGVNVDIVRSKNNILLNSITKIKKPSLGILYDDVTSIEEEYISNLKKILNFCEIYGLDKIYLRYADVYYLFGDLKNYNMDSFQTIIDGYVDSKYDDLYYSLDIKSLHSLIEEVSKIQINRDFMLELSEGVSDLAVRDALDNYFLDGDLDKLRDMIKARLSLHLNSDGVYKDRNGKIYQTITLQEEYVNVLTNNQNGEVIRSEVIPLVDYLGVLDYQDLIDKLDNISDEESLDRIAAIYLYLLGFKGVKKNDNRDSLSCYDRIYESFMANKKKLPSMYKKHMSCILNLTNKALVVVVMMALVLSTIAVGAGLDFISYFLFHNNNSSIAKNIMNTIVKPYYYAYSLEKDMVGDVLDKVSFDNIDFPDLSFTGDQVESDETKQVGYIRQFDKMCEMPKYYASGYATDRSYASGNIKYEIETPLVDFDSFFMVNPVLSVNYEIGKNELRKMISNNRLDLEQSLTPLGDNYVVTSIHIKDNKDANKIVLIDAARAQNSGNFLTDKEVEILRSMKRPEVEISYGLATTFTNSFNDSLSNGDFAVTPEIREAIIEGLGLCSDASIDEVLKAIENKYYSTTPIRDAGKTREVKYMSEVEYFKTIAGLDSLICNLAATMASESDEELVYVVGFHDNYDGVLISGEAHAWAMRENGNIIDVTPSTSLVHTAPEEFDLVSAITNFAVSYKLPLGVFLLLLTCGMKKLYGKDIVLNIKALKIKRMVNNNLDEAYARIMEELYGGINIPDVRSPEEFIDDVKFEFAGLSKEDLKRLKKELESIKLDDKELKARMIEIVKEIPYIKENSEELKRVLAKSKIS